MPEEAPKKDRLAITIQGKFNQSRDVVFQTTVSLEQSAAEIYKEFSRICEIMDRREEFYMLKGMRLLHERRKSDLAKQIAQVQELREHAAVNWEKSNRKGEVVLSGQEKHNIENQLSSIKIGRDELAKLESDIRELEELQKASA